MRDREISPTFWNSPRHAGGRFKVRCIHAVDRPPGGIFEGQTFSDQGERCSRGDVTPSVHFIDTAHHEPIFGEKRFFFVFFLRSNLICKSAMALRFILSEAAHERCRR